MQSCTSTQRQSLARGTNNHIFKENGNKYCCVGSQPGRAERGVQSGLYRLKYGFPSKEWDSNHRVLKHAEYAFDRYMGIDIIQHISCARSWAKFKTMEPSPSLTHEKSTRYYNEFGFGINVNLRSHINWDFTMSIVQAHIDNHDYQINDRISCYFAFPRMERLWHFGLVTFYYLIHRNRTLFLLAVNRETKYFAFFLTLKQGLLV
jgi:hypothetical protein